MSQATEMTDAELIEKVARGLGYEFPGVVVTRGTWPDREEAFIAPGGMPTSIRHLPPWLTSIDACQRDLLPDLERRGELDAFVYRLCRLVWPEAEYLSVQRGQMMARLLRASARQWCEAFLEVVETN